MGEVQRCVRMDSCCMQEERWRGQVARFLGMQGRRYRLCRPENSDGRGGVGLLVKEELWRGEGGVTE